MQSDKLEHTFMIVSKDVEQLDISYASDRSVNLYNHFIKSFDSIY